METNTFSQSMQTNHKLDYNIRADTSREEIPVEQYTRRFVFGRVPGRVPGVKQQIYKLTKPGNANFSMESSVK